MGVEYIVDPPHSAEYYRDRLLDLETYGLTSCQCDICKTVRAAAMADLNRMMKLAA